MKQPRHRTIAAAALLACSAMAPAQANIIWQFQLPGQSDSLSVITDGDTVGGVAPNAKYNVLDVVITASSVFGPAVVGYSVLGGQLRLGTNGGASPNGNFLYWHGPASRFEINDGDANLNGTYGSGSWMDIAFTDPASLGYASAGYWIMSWFGGVPNQMYALKNNAVVGGGALTVGALQPADAATVPEPATLLLGAAALAALGCRRARTGSRTAAHA